MKNTDKFLLAIVAGIVLLIGVAVAVVLLRPQPTYRPDDTPEGVAHNYLLALQRKDYARAYSYLSSGLAGYPDSETDFIADVKNYDYNFSGFNGSTTLEVASSAITGESAVVTVNRTVFYSNGLFSSRQYTNTFEMTLKLESQGWKISGSDSYWVSCWDKMRGCR